MPALDKAVPLDASCEFLGPWQSHNDVRDVGAYGRIAVGVDERCPVQRPHERFFGRAEPGAYEDAVGAEGQSRSQSSPVGDSACCQEHRVR